jgi:hypothetical protein
MTPPLVEKFPHPAKPIRFEAMEKSPLLLQIIKTVSGKLLYLTVNVTNSTKDGKK